MSKQLRVVVHYPPAAQPFRKNGADPSETEGQLKVEVLGAFGLKEGPQPDGTNITYTLYEGKTALENAAETLGALAGQSEELQLKLAQQITQGDM
jgi:hypothetical protein